MSQSGVKVPEEQRREVVARVEAGATHAAVAEALGLARSTVGIIAREAGIRRRGNGQAKPRSRPIRGPKKLAAEEREARLAKIRAQIESGELVIRHDPSIIRR